MNKNLSAGENTLSLYSNNTRAFLRSGSQNLQ